MKKINIVTGHYGSGKTEFAINYALKLKESHGSSVICDMDIVNPYFRTNDAVSFLKNEGVSVIAPEYANTNLDLPSLPSDIISVFSENSPPSVLDVGGDDDGAIALGQFYPYLSKEDYEMFFVINALRPDTSSADGIIKLIKDIEYVSRCKVTSLVNNTNLSYLSSVKDITDSISLIDEVSNLTGIKVKYISGKEDILSKLPEELKEKLFPLKLFMQLPFDAFA
ncbi:MAG: ATP-binding protein [Clostridia bacterium]|nr:ATP-binding protein [Clostridia bacterium]